MARLLIVVVVALATTLALAQDTTDATTTTTPVPSLPVVESGPRLWLQAEHWDVSDCVQNHFEQQSTPEWEELSEWQFSTDGVVDPDRVDFTYTVYYKRYDRSAQPALCSFTNATSDLRIEWTGTLRFDNRTDGDDSDRDYTFAFVASTTVATRIAETDSNGHNDGDVMLSTLCPALNISSDCETVPGGESRCDLRTLQCSLPGTADCEGSVSYALFDASTHYLALSRRAMCACDDACTLATAPTWTAAAIAAANAHELEQLEVNADLWWQQTALPEPFPSYSSASSLATSAVGAVLAVVVAMLLV